MPSHHRLHSRVLSVIRLDLGVRDAMYRLFVTYYDRADRICFDKQLSEKDEVITIWHDGVLCGFTTLQWFLFSHEGREVSVIFSGDTIIDRRYWGHQELAAAWLRQVGLWSQRCPDRPLYWLLIVKGHRTYRYMPAFGIEFVPNWREGAGTQELLSLRDGLARHRFGGEFDAGTGVARFRNGNRLRPEIAQPTERERCRPDVAFFLESNPGYAEGDELVCLCPLTPENMRPFGRRIYEQGRRSVC
jgi:hypothetical protein